MDSPDYNYIAGYVKLLMEVLREEIRQNKKLRRQVKTLSTLISRITYEE